LQKRKHSLAEFISQQKVSEKGNEVQFVPLILGVVRGELVIVHCGEVCGVMSELALPSPF
jgi:hypothetical protein